MSAATSSDLPATCWDEEDWINDTKSLHFFLLRLLNETWTYFEAMVEEFLFEAGWQKLSQKVEDLMCQQGFQTELAAQYSGGMEEWEVGWHLKIFQWVG